MGLTDGGTGIAAFIADLSAFVGDAGGLEGDVAAAIDSDEDRLFTITAGPDTGPKFVNNVTMQELLDENYNSSFDNPTKEDPNISIIQFHDVALNFANRDAGVVGTFMNMIPTIEMSKCQPFVDIKIITTMAPVDEATKKLGDGISLFRFLHGKADAYDGDKLNLTGRLASALPLGLDPTLTVKKNPDGTTAYDENGQPVLEETAVTVAGMEVFTSPQTMVDADNHHTDLGPPVEGQLNAARPTPTIDKFRPFMTFKSLNLKVAPTRGMMSTQTGDIAFTLHDRSRLHEISSFVRPSGLGEIELLVDYGWTHPEYGQGTNPIADLIGSMKHQQKFGIQNSTLSFNDVGEVDIKCKIYTKGSYETTSWLITSAEISDQVAVMQRLFKDIRELKRKIRGDLDDNEEMVGQDVLGKANSAQAIMGMSREDRAELNSLVRSLKNNEGEYGDLGAKLGEVAGNADSFGNMIDAWFTSVTNGIDKKPDPFIKVQEENGIRARGELSSETDPARGKDHVSFARLCLDFIAAPLAATRKFDEVQLLFYPFNSQSSWCFDLDVGCFPVNKANFFTIMKEEFKKRPAMTIASFIGKMNSNFFGNMACDAYGFADLYDRDPETGKAKLAKAYEKNKSEQAKVSSEKKKVLAKAYGSTDASLSFKRPQVQIYIECVPQRKDQEGGNQKTILRLHFFDSACTSYSGFSQMWDSLRSSLSSSINRAAVSENKNFSEPPDKTGPANQGSKHGDSWGRQWAVVEALDLLETINSDAVADWIDYDPKTDAAGNTPREDDTDQEKAVLERPYVRIKGGPAGMRYLLTRNMPSIKYGTATSAVIAASLATKSDGKMATIHMTSVKPAGSKPGQDDGLPLRTFPSSLSLETYGCPAVQFGQQFFVDFGTGTSLDDVYVVTGIDHTLAPGDFKTKLKLSPMQKFGQFQSLTQNISKMMASASDLKNSSS